VRDQRDFNYTGDEARAASKPACPE
jgi:hypothetical protein